MTSCLFPCGVHFFRNTPRMESPSNGNSLTRSYLNIFSVVVLYWIVSISLVFINKTLLDPQSHQSNVLDAPMFISWFQCVIAVALYCILSIGSNKCRQIGSSPKLSELKINYDTAWKMLPLSLIFVTMMTFNNLCLKHLGVSFYYVGRSLVHIFNVILTWFILGQKTSKNVLFCCAIIFTGFWLGIQQEDAAGSLSVLGTIYGVLSSLFLSLNSIYTKKLLSVVDDSIWLLGYYNNVISCVLFLPLILLNGELKVLVAFEGFGDLAFWGMMTAGGFFGFAIGYVMGLQIQMTSPLTNTISGTAKACAQTVMATHIYGEVKPILWWVSNWVVLFGSAAYARVRQLEMQRGHHNQANIPSNPSSVRIEDERSTISKV